MHTDITTNDKPKSYDMLLSLGSAYFGLLKRDTMSYCNNIMIRRLITK